MQKSLDIFKAEPQSVFDVLCDRKSTGFYLPAYQRPYSWEEKHIKDLFSDCENVFRNLLESPDAIIFLGSILSVDDSEGKTIYPPSKRNHTPVNIKLVIDGQQRLSTLILIILCLNEKLNLFLPKLKSKIEKTDNEEVEEVLDGLREIVSQLVIDTSNFVIETQADHELYKYLPKIIRSQIDCWGKDEKKAGYHSPLAEVLIKYQRHLIEYKDLNRFKEFSLSEVDEGSKRIVDNIKIIRKQLKSIEQGFKSNNTQDDQESALTIEDLVDKNTLDECLDFPVDSDLLALANEDKNIEEVIFIAIFTKFLLHRVCLTYVEVNNESYAFDMFEALNTTGEPLTALETFVPKVIEHFGDKKKQGEDNIDNTTALLKSITDRFEALTKAKEKNDKTKALILAFVRAYKGQVKVTSLRDQRDSMLSSYDNCHYSDKDDYLYYLKRTTDFLFDYWQAKAPNLQGLVPESELEQANLCMLYLTDIKHDITSSLLIQFLLLDEKYDVVGSNDSQFFKLLKAVTSLSVLWRAMSGGADGIDGVYKKLHEKGIEIHDQVTKPFQLCNASLQADLFDVEKVKQFFKYELDNKIANKGSPKELSEDRWFDVCLNQQMLAKPKGSKMITLAGFHGLSMRDNEFIQENTGSNDFLTITNWELLHSTDRISKIFEPERATGDDWDSTVKVPEVFNRLGNILIDARCNIASKKSRSWYETRQNMLKSLNNDALDDIDSLAANYSGLSEESKRLLAIYKFENKYSEITYAADWNEDAVNQRTEVLLKNAWHNLIKWLE
jgi:uncharacterized protein with ParB-like and HNH nuclease domain